MKKDWNNIITDCMCELYANATPKADFNELVQYAKDNNVMDQFGRYDIHFEDYEIEEAKFREIFDSYVKKYKIKKPWLYSFTVEIYLGASPKTKRNE